MPPPLPAMPPHPPTVGQQLWLGNRWQPVAADLAWARVDYPSGCAHVLIMETPVGRLGIQFTPDALARFLDAARAELAGLQVAESVQAPPAQAISLPMMRAR